MISNGKALQNAPWVVRGTGLRPFDTDEVRLKAGPPVPQERLAMWQSYRFAPGLSPKDCQQLPSHPCLLTSCNRLLVSSHKPRGKAGGRRETEAGRHNISLREHLEDGKLAGRTVSGRKCKVCPESSAGGLGTQLTPVTTHVVEAFHQSETQSNFTSELFLDAIIYGQKTEHRNIHLSHAGYAPPFSSCLTRS